MRGWYTTTGSLFRKQYGSNCVIIRNILKTGAYQNANKIIKKPIKMKTKTLKKVTVITMAAALLALNSCQKENPNLQTQSSGNDMSLGIKALNASQLAVTSLDNSSNSYKMESSLSSCAVITNDTVSKPHVYTINYGAGCTSSDGVLRSGK